MTIVRHDFDLDATWRSPNASGSVNISAIGEIPAGTDERLGAVFRDMRRLTGVDRLTVARKLGTTVDVLMALELGDVRAVRPSNELRSLVHRYADWVGIDPKPVYDRILRNFAPMPVTARQAAERVVDRGRAQRAQNGKAEDDVDGRTIAGGRAARLAPIARSKSPVTIEGVTPRRRTGLRRPAVFAIGLPLLLIAGVWFAAGEARLSARLASILPTAVSDTVRSFGGATADKKLDGLRWIDVEEPRSRKGDKLQFKAR